MSNTNTIETSSSFSIHPPNHPPNQSNPFCNVVAQKFAFSSQSSVRTSPLSWVRKFASFAFWPVIHRIGLLSTWWEIVFQIIIFPTICSTDEGDECSLFFFLSSSCTAMQFLPTQQMISFLIAQSHTMIAIIIIVLHSVWPIHSSKLLVLLERVVGLVQHSIHSTQFILCGWKW